MEKSKKIIALLGMISALSLTGCQDKIEVPTGEYTTIDDNEVTEEEAYETEVVEEQEESIEDEINLYDATENIEDFVCVLSVQSPLSDKHKYYTFVKEMDYSTSTEHHPDESPLYDDIAEIIDLSHLENKEELLKGECNFTLVKYQSTTSENATYGEKIFTITYDSNGEEKTVELIEQQFGDYEESLFFYVLAETTEEGVHYDWSFIDNEDNVFFHGAPVPFEMKTYSYEEVMDRLLEYENEEKGATLGLTKEN